MAHHNAQPSSLVQLISLNASKPDNGDDSRHGGSFQPQVDSPVLPQAPRFIDVWKGSQPLSRWISITFHHDGNVFMRTFYSYCFFRLPSHYISRVVTILINANISIAQWEAIEEAERRRQSGQGGSADFQAVDVMGKKLAKSCAGFVESLQREWNTLNIVSVLLLSAILAIVQIDDAMSFWLTRYTAFFALISALMSLLYGCLFLVQFGSMERDMKSPSWATQWAGEALKTTPNLWWNIWVMISMPAVSLCWAIVSFIVCVMSFMWHSALTDGNATNSIPSKPAMIAGCVFVSLALCIGLLYLVLIIWTFREWSIILKRWQESTMRSVHPLEHLYDDPVSPALSDPGTHG